MRFARQEILMSQLFFAIPKVFDSRPDGRDAEHDLRLRPAGSGRSTAQPRAVKADDRRPERVILLVTRCRGVDVRILLHAFTVPLFIKIVAGILLFPFVGTDGIYLALELLGVDLTDTDEVKRYFIDDGDGAATSRSQAFEQPVLSAGVMHAKLMMMDRNRMLSIGSPFGQSYVDRQDHAIDAWIRGGADGFPKHDAGFTMTGPAHARFLRDDAAVLERRRGSGDQLPVEMRDPTLPPVIAPPPPGPSVLNEPGRRHLLGSDRPDPQLRSVLRQSERARRAFSRPICAGSRRPKEFIYLETQYFTNDAIGDGLVDAMLGTPGLQVIVLLNIEPDVPTYPFKQRRLITRIRRAIGQTATGPQRFGVFTRWTPRSMTGRVRVRASCRSTSTRRSGSSTTPGRRSARPTSTACRSTRLCRATS